MLGLTRKTSTGSYAERVSDQRYADTGGDRSARIMSTAATPVNGPVEGTYDAALGERIETNAAVIDVGDLPAAWLSNREQS